MSVTTKVAAGRAYLNQEFPGWDRFIDLDELSLHSEKFCVLGQLARKDPRLEERIRAWREEANQKLLERGGTLTNLPALKLDFFSASWALGLTKTGKNAAALGFDAEDDDDEDDATIADLEDEWREVIEEEQKQWRQV